MDFQILQVAPVDIFHIYKHVMGKKFLHPEADFFLKKSLPEEIGLGHKRKPGLNYRIDILDDSRGLHFFINGHFPPTGISFEPGNVL